MRVRARELVEFGIAFCEVYVVVSTLQGEMFLYIIICSIYDAIRLLRSEWNVKTIKFQNEHKRVLQIITLDNEKVWYN